MSYKSQFIFFIVLTILMLAISLTKKVWGNSKRKPGVKKFTIYGYILTGLAASIIIGLSVNIKHFNKIEENWYLTQKFDDTLYSLSKQLFARDLIYDKQTNQIKTRYKEEGLFIGQSFQWINTSLKNTTRTLFCQLSLQNNCPYTITNIKGNIVFFSMKENHFFNLYKNVTYFSQNFKLPPNYFVGPSPEAISVNSSYNMFYTKFDYEDEDGHSMSPIRQIYLTNANPNEGVWPKRVFNSDSFNLVKAYLIKNNIW